MTLIKDIQSFIDLNLHTLPLNGKYIKRDERGKKHGFSMPSDWQNTYSKTLNEIASPIGGLLTGRGGLVAIDCDDDKTWRLFRSLDPTYTAYMDSVGKLDKEGNLLTCGTILYKYSEELPPSFRNTNGYDLDYYNGSGFVFLPTAPNETKSAWKLDGEGKLCNNKAQLIEFREMPQTVIDLLDLMRIAPAPAKSVAETSTSRSKGFLGKALEDIDFTNHELYQPLVTKILTPKEYRSQKYVKQGHLHPNDMQGSGHMYLFKIASILAGDNTVDKDLFYDIMDYINNLWDDPMPDKLLAKTILKPVVSGQYWEYDENWEEAQGVCIINKLHGHMIDIFYDPMKRTFYNYNTITDYIEDFDKARDMYNHLHVSSVNGIAEQTATKSMPNILTETEPQKDYGYSEDSSHFNLFKPNESLVILHDPKSYEQHYRQPKEFISYLEHMIPSEQQRDYILSLIRTKVTTFSYSPVVPYIIGIQGSGKNLLMGVIANIIGHDYVAQDVTGSQFIEKYNDWIMDKYFVHLNEMAETLPTKKEQKQAQGALKTYTGSEVFQVRAMRAGYTKYPQKAMFIMTANSSPLTIEDTDRRLYYVSTPNTFDHSPQCLASDPATIYKAILAQTKDIAYYLATEVKNLKPADYVRAPRHEGRDRMIFETLNISSKIAWSLANGHIDLLLSELEVNPTYLFANKSKGMITLNNLISIYEDLGHSEDSKGTMNTAMKVAGLMRHPVKASGNIPQWHIAELIDFNYTEPVDEDAEEINLEQRT